MPGTGFQRGRPRTVSYLAARDTEDQPRVRPRRDSLHNTPMVTHRTDEERPRAMVGAQASSPSSPSLSSPSPPPPPLLPRKATVLLQPHPEFHPEHPFQAVPDRVVPLVTTTNCTGTRSGFRVRSSRIGGDGWPRPMAVHRTQACGSAIALLMVAGVRRPVAHLIQWLHLRARVADCRSAGTERPVAQVRADEDAPSLGILLRRHGTWIVVPRSLTLDQVSRMVCAGCRCSVRGHACPHPEHAACA